MEVAAALVGDKVSFGVAKVVVRPVRINKEQLMASKVVFGSSNKVVFGDAK